MLIKEPSDFHDSMKPLLYFNYFLGIDLYRQPNISDAVYLAVQAYMIFNTLVNWVSTYIGLTALREFTVQFYDTSSMALTMYEVLIVTNSCVTVTVSIFIWLRRKGLAKCLRVIPILDLKIEAIVGARNEYRTRYVQLIKKIIVIIVILTVVGVSNSVWSQKCPLPLLLNVCIGNTVHYPIIILLVLDLNFCTFVSYLGKKFRDLNDCVLGLVEKPVVSSSRKRVFVVSRNVVRTTQVDEMKSDGVEGLVNDKHYVLHEIRRAHLELCKLSRMINQVFGIQNLLSMAISFVMITGLLYTVYSAILWDKFTDDRVEGVVSSLAWVLIYTLKVWSVNHSCWVVSNESKRTGVVIYELLKPKIDGELQKQVQEFAVQMLQNPVRFNACGFFTLDYTFIQGVIGSVTTYLVILIQMSNVSDTSERSAPRTFAGCNSTY